MAKLILFLYRWLGGLRADPEEFTSEDWRVAPEAAKDNPLWCLNHAHRRGEGRRRIGAVAFVAVWCLIAALTGFAASTRWGLRAGIGFWLFSFPLQMYGALGILRDYEFVRGRRWVLEDLVLTSMDWKSIGFGSCNRAVRASGWFVIALILSEVILFGFISPVALAVALMFFAPLRWQLHGLTVSHGLRYLPQPSSDLHLFAVLFMPVVILGKLGLAIGVIMAPFVVFAILLALLDADGAILILTIPALFMAFYGWVAMMILGNGMIRRGYGEAIHTYKTMVAEKDPIVSLRPEAIRPEPEGETPFFYGKRKSDEPEETDVNGGR